MKKILFTVLLILLLSTPAQSAQVVSFGSLTGGTAGALDAIPCDNADNDATADDPLATGDRAYGIDSGTFYVYAYNDTSTAAESSPDVIVPDNQADCGNAGVWELVQGISLKYLSDVSGIGSEGRVLVDDGDGTFSFSNILTVSEFILPYGTDAAPVEEGSIYWNTSTKKLSVGDGSSAVVINP